jgi:acetyl esterase
VSSSEIRALYASPVSRVRSTIVLELAIRVIFRLFPSGLRRFLAGPAIQVDGQTLDPDLQLLLRLERLTSAGTPSATVQRRRAHLDAATALVGGPVVPGVRTREIAIIGEPAQADPDQRPTGNDPIAARLYTPDGLPPGSPLLVFQHGGGWVTGSLDSHDPVCRYLAKHAAVRVLAVGYRLAPEHPFPAAVGDVVTAFRFARRHAAELGADPSKVALGGDSAGANLAAVAAHLAARAGEPIPAFLLLFYPPCDAINRSRSRDLFAAGFMLTDDDIVWFCDHYLPPSVDRGDPRASLLLADDLSGMPPTYLVTAGFDPIRDEGEMLARRMAEAGVPVVLRRHPDLVHGFVNMIGLSVRCREAVAEAAGALRMGLMLAGAANGIQPVTAGRLSPLKYGAPGQTRTDTVRDLDGPSPDLR